MLIYLEGLKNGPAVEMEMADLDAREAKNGDFIVPEIPVATWDAKVGAHDGSDTLAPLIFDCWYVIALAKDVDRTLGSIKVLGEPLVYYRTEDGRPACSTIAAHIVGSRSRRAALAATRSSAAITASPTRHRASASGLPAFR